MLVYYRNYNPVLSKVKLTDLNDNVLKTHYTEGSATVMTAKHSAQIPALSFSDVFMLML